MSISTNALKNGMALNLPSEGLVTVLEFQHVKPGKGGAFVRTKLKKVASGAVLERTFRADEKVPLALIDKREMQYLYRESDSLVFMDSESYDQMHVATRDLGSAVKEIQASMQGVKLPVGYTVEIGGQFESQRQAFRELLLVLGIAASLVLVTCMPPSRHRANGAGGRGTEPRWGSSSHAAFFHPDCTVGSGRPG